MVPVQIMRWEHWRRWAGEPADFIKAAQVCHEELEKWPGAERVLVEVEVKRPRSLKTFDDVDALSALGIHEWREATEVEVWVRALGRGRNMSYARLDLSREEIVLAVRGFSETAVLGLVAAVKEILDRGRQRPSWLRRWNVLLGGCFTAGLSITPAMFLPRAWGATGFAGDDRLSSQERIAAAIGVGGVLLLTAALVWLLPTIEILEPGQRPRLRRFGALVVGLVLSLAVAVVSSLLVR